MAVDAFISVLIQVVMRTACSVLSERSSVPLFPGLKLILVCGSLQRLLHLFGQCFYLQTVILGLMSQVSLKPESNFNY